MNFEFSRYTLSNGIELIVKENHHAQSVVTRGYLPGGARLDPPDRPGLVSFMADAMRRGTSKRTYAEINETAEAVSASVYINAGRHLVSFGGKSLAEDFELLVELMSDNLLCPTFPTQEVEKLRSETITDLRESEDDTRDMARRYFRETLYPPDHPYSRPVEGTIQSISALKTEELLDCYRQLHPQGGAIIVVGHVRGQAVYETLEKALGEWSPGHPPPDLAIPDPPAPTEPLKKIHHMAEKSQADLVLGGIGPARLAEDYYAAYIGNTILGQLGLGGRIGLSVREEQGMAYYAYAYLQGGLGPGPWFIYAGVNPAAIEQTVETFLAEIDRFRQTEVSPEELADAKAYLTGTLPLQMESNEGTASILMRIQLYGLGDDYIDRYPDIINAITAGEVLAAAQKYLSAEAYALSIAGPYQAGE